MLFLLLACQSKPPHNNDHVVAASAFTQRYTHSRQSAWNVRGNAAGPDCDVLLVDTSVIMDDSMIEAMHYGAGAYDAVDGGVQRFCRERAFRGVAYKDASGKIWAYGAVTAEQARTLTRCR
jgi:hypothetical protein